MHIAFYSKAVKISSKPFPSLASADRDASKQTLATRRGELMILRVTAATWPVPAARRETGLRPPGKPECFQHSRGVGWAPGEEAQSARQGRTNSAIACVLPAAFQMKAQLLVTGKSPKARRDRDIPLQTSSQAEGQRRWGLSMILCLAREELSTPWEAWHRLLVWLS